MTINYSENVARSIELAHRSLDITTSEFAQKVLEDGLMYTLSWADSTADHVAFLNYQAQVWEAARREAGTNPNPEDIQAQVPRQVLIQLKRLEEALLRGHFRARSTSMFSNATTSAEAEGASRFVDYYGHYEAHLVEEGVAI